MPASSFRPITFEILLGYTHKIKQIKLFRIAGYSNCEQVQFLSRTQAKCDVARTPETFGKMMAAMGNACNGFLRLNRFSLKNGTFDFEITNGCVNCTLTFYCCSQISIW